MRLKKMTITGWKSFEDITLDLGQINVIVGRNNSGKSAILRAAQFLQPGTFNVAEREIRLGSDGALVKYSLEDFDVPRYASELATNGALEGLAEGGRVPWMYAEVSTARQSSGQPWVALSLLLKADSEHIWGGYPKISPAEPNNFIYPYLSKRKVHAYDTGVDSLKASQVSGTLQHLSAKVARLRSPGFPGAEQFTVLCERLLGLPLGSILVEGGQLVGFTVGRLGPITIESMGEGVASVLGLITDLCVAENQLFLIEEPENDIHPQGLKALLDVIVEKAATNQFIVSTHSNIVVKYLASAPDSRLFSVEQHKNEFLVPTSTVRLIDSPEERGEVLRELGYELHDFDLAEGWILLEESSAERLIRDYLIPWFAPKLTRIRTIAAQGTGDVEVTFKEFAKLVLFIHREETLKHRAWVVVDGDASGIAVTEKLAAKYNTWPADRFRCWTKERFEDYYPPRFQQQIDDAFSKPKGLEQQRAKSAVRQSVQDWCDENRDEARRELAESAAEVIEVLQQIERDLSAGPRGHGRLTRSGPQ